MYSIRILAIIVAFKYTNCINLYGFQNNFLLNLVNIEHNASIVSEGWIEQPLDHFTAENSRWQMRYFKRLDLWKPNGPVYIFITGEGKADSRWIQSDSFLICQLARETNGAIFSTEHRYYGKSLPVQPITIPSLKYLSSQQALADLAKLIKFIKSAPEFKSSKVVVIGGSYAGNLAAWARLLYPDLIDAAVASSGPVLAKKDFYEYLETVNDVYKEYGTPGCLEKIRKMFSRYTTLLETPSGREQLKRELNICKSTDMSIIENQQLFFIQLTYPYGDIAQYGTPDVVRKHCESLPKSLSPFETCKNYDFNSLIQSYLHHFRNYLPWIYQTCTEFGYFVTTTSSNQPFGKNVNVKFFVKLCTGLFGEDYNEKRVDTAVARTNAKYGGTTPKVTNVIFTHGGMDPWHSLGVLTNLSDTALVRISPGTSHCRILIQAIREPAALTEDREYVKSVIKKWIA